MKGTSGKLPPSRDASSELQAVVERLDYLQDLSRQVKFRDISESVDRIKFMIIEIMLALNDLNTS